MTVNRVERVRRNGLRVAGLVLSAAAVASTAHAQRVVNDNMGTEYRSRGDTI